MDAYRRAYSTFEVKRADQDDGVIEGWASTPTVDGDGDVMVPGGAEYSLPLPLLWQHDRQAPIGEVFDAAGSAKGIYVSARVKRIKEPGPLKDRLDLAWQSVRHGLVKGLSIGFTGLAFEPIRETSGRRFTRWKWVELSCVTIPSNQEATVTAIKSADLAVRRRLGLEPRLPRVLYGELAVSRAKAEVARLTPQLSESREGRSRCLC